MSKPDPATARNIMLFAISAGAVTSFANGHLPHWRNAAMGLAATAFWLFVGRALFLGREARESTCKAAGKPDPLDPLD